MKCEGKCYKSSCLDKSSCDLSFFKFKYDNNYNWKWINRINGSGSEIGLGVITDDHCNVFITGKITGTIIFDEGGSNQTNVTHNGAFIAKYDKDGQFNMVKLLNTEQGFDLDIDIFGDIIVVGKTFISSRTIPKYYCNLI